MADLPDWLLALLQGQQPQPAGPIAPAGGPPSMSSLAPSPPWAPQGLLAQGPSDAPPAFTYVNPSSPALGGSPEPLDTSYGAPGQPYRLPGAPPTWAGQLASMPNVGSAAGSADVPLPPRRPGDLSGFRATVDTPRVASEGDVPDTATPAQPLNLRQPPAAPTSNVIGTPASGSPETPSPFGGVGNVLGKVGDAIGGIYGAGGPGDALIALGLSNRTGGKSIEALNAAGNQRLNQAKLAAFNLQMQQETQRQNQTFNYFKSKGLSDQEAITATVNPELQKKKFEELAGPDNYINMTEPGTNDVYAVNKHDPTDRKLVFKGVPDKPFVIGEDSFGAKTYGIMNREGKTVRTDENGRPMDEALASQSDKTTEAAANLPPVDTSKAPNPGSPEAASVKDRGEKYLSTLPGGATGGIAATVRGIAEGREPFPVGYRGKAAAALKTMVNQYDPYFDFTNSDARHVTRQDFAKGEAAKTITTGNTTIGHIGHMSDWAEKLAQSNTSSPMFNSWKNRVRVNLGGGLDAINYDTWADLVSREATKFYSPGGGTGEERAALKERLQSAASPDQLRSTLKTITDAVNSKVSALQDRWHQGMGPLAKDYPILTPESQATLAKVSDRVSGVEGGTAGGDATTAPEAPATPPPKLGEIRKGYRYIGGPDADWHNEKLWVKVGVQM